jgi:Arm DNA-binding domain/Phage integrase, N-terminal SAM-like domain
VQYSSRLSVSIVLTQPSCRLVIDFYYRGVRCRERLKLAPNPANRRYASRLKAEIESRIARGEFNYAEFFPYSPRARTLSRRAGDAITVREVLRRYVDTAERSLQRSTWLDYKRSVNSNLIPAFGELHLSELTRAKLREWASGLDVTPKRLANILLPLRAVLKDAAADEIIDRNVLHGWKPEIKARLRDETAIDPFAPDEIRLIRAACDGQLRNLVQFGFWTGVRTSELFALRWPDVDWGMDRCACSERACAVKPRPPRPRRACAMSSCCRRRSRRFRRNERILNCLAARISTTTEPMRNGRAIKRSDWDRGVARCAMLGCATATRIKCGTPREHDAVGGRESGMDCSTNGPRRPGNDPPHVRAVDA